MSILDPKFKSHCLTYVFQSLLAALLIFIVLYFSEFFSNMVVIASLGASVFIAFTVPHAVSSNPRRLMGGYATGSLCGIFFNYIGRFLIDAGVYIIGHSPHILVCAAAVGISMLIMTALNFEHPPAAALAMGLVVEKDVFATVFVAILGISAISAFKYVIRKWLKDLL